jgi:hypothetical protein
MIHLVKSLYPPAKYFGNSGKQIFCGVAITAQKK